MGGGPSQPAASSGIPSVTAFEKDGLKITFDFAKDPGNPGMHGVHCEITCIDSNPSRLLAISLQHC